jgi:hypothetical protein
MGGKRTREAFRCHRTREKPKTRKFLFES